ncbi:hypothetical protein H9Q80_14385 [[Eubacterium] hominis]|uniref:DNA sulfur modification protein DndB n=1 Tax=[Eubacterium] hominis TaxID=2764325 RepID=A0A7G9GKU7_9FIRM|nr:hypothetical protein H9Q80_14385 [[Eubacterium] hominis]
MLNDGQHRKATIERAFLEKTKLDNEIISIVFYKDLKLRNSQ